MDLLHFDLSLLLLPLNFTLIQSVKSPFTRMYLEICEVALQALS